jgi:hypothetical protein
LDSSSFVRCRRAVIPTAGKGERSALPGQSTPRRDPARKDSPARDRSVSPRATPRAASPGNRGNSGAMSPRGMASPRSGRPGNRHFALSPRSDGKGTKNTRLPGDVLSSLSRCSTKGRMIPKPGQHSTGSGEEYPLPMQERSFPRTTVKACQTDDEQMPSVDTQKQRSDQAKSVSCGTSLVEIMTVEDEKMAPPQRVNKSEPTYV